MEIVREMGSSSQWGLIMAPGQEANDDDLGIADILDNNVCWVHSLESPQWVHTTYNFMTK